LLLLVIVTDLWLGTTRMTINPRTVRSRHTIAGIGATRVMAPNESSKIDLHTACRPLGGREGLYEIRITKPNDRRGSLGSGIRNKAHAEWLAREMRSPMGLPS